MKLRCIHCGIQESDDVVLSDTFECMDVELCEDRVNKKRQPILSVCIWSDCACIYGEETHLGISVYTEINGVYSEEFSGHKYIGTGTVPYGEWTALLYALSVGKLIKNKHKNAVIKFFVDAQVVSRTFNGDYKPGKFQKQYNKSMQLKNNLGHSFSGLVWLPREHNRNADKLSKLALAHLQK